MSEQYIVPFCQRCEEAAKIEFGQNYEIILVNDGSPDNSLKIAIEYAQKNEKIKVIDLSRNFGHHKAIMTGLDHCLGDLVFLIDSDLEESPEWLHQFLVEIHKSNADVIYGIQAYRKGRIFEKISGLLFWKLFEFLTRQNIPRSQTTARLMKNNYVRSLLRYQERELFIGAIWWHVGFKQLPIFVTKKSTSPTTYTLTKKLIVFIESITSFSNAPLYFIVILGFLIIFLSSICLLMLITAWLFSSMNTPPGWLSILASIWLIGGILILFIGILGIYLAKIYIETKQRPYSIIKNIYQQKRHDDSSTMIE